MTLGQYLREQRTAKGIGLRELARLAHYTPGYLSTIERDEERPGEDVLLAYAQHLELPSDDLLLRAHRIPGDVAAILYERPDLIRFIREHATDAEQRSGAFSSIGITVGKSVYG